MVKKFVRRRKPEEDGTERPSARSAEPERASKRQAIASSVFIAETVRDARVEYNDAGIYLAGEGSGLVIGIPYPSFCLEYLTQNTVFPLGRVVVVLGEEATSKSGLCFEITRWFREYANGVGVYLENESKYSPDWAMSIIGWDQPDALAHVRCRSMNDWQSKLMFFLNRAKQTMLGDGKNKGTGKTWPLVITVDSLTGKPTDFSIDQIEKKGSADRGHPVEAMSITRIMRKIPEDIADWPFTFIGVNHIKPTTDQGGLSFGGPAFVKPGGKQVQYQETLEFLMSRAAGSDIKMADREGSRLQLKCGKNSLGVRHRKITVEVVWWDEEIVDPETGEMTWRQKTVWDWHKATIELLLGLDGSEKTRASKVLDLHRVPNKTQVWSDRLGIPQKAPVSYSEAGAILQENGKVLDELRYAFGVKKRTVFAPGMDYGTQRQEEKLRLKSKAPRRKIGKPTPRGES